MTIKKGLSRFTAVATEIPRIHYRKGLEDGFSGDYESAIEHFDRVNYITLGSSFWTNQSQYYKAEAYVQLEEYDKAAEEYKKFLENNKKHSTGWNNLGASYLELDKYSDALSCLDNAIKFESEKKYPDRELLEAIWVNRGNIYSGYLSEFNDLKKEKGIHPVYLDPDEFLDNADEMRKKILISLEQCTNEILEINSESYDGLDLKQELLFNQDKLDEALEICKIITQLFPDKKEGWNALGLVYDATNNYEESLQCYKKGLEIKPNESLFWYNKACAFSKMNKIDDALDSLLVAISISPENLNELTKESDFNNIKNTERFQKFLNIPI